MDLRVEGGFVRKVPFKKESPLFWSKFPLNFYRVVLLPWDEGWLR